MADTTVTTKFKLVTEGGDQAVADMGALAEDADLLATALEAANRAADGLASSVGAIPDVPLAQSSDQFWQASKKTDEALKKTTEAQLDAGKASDILFNALDNVVPGLGHITESLFSMNPVAIASTAAVVGLSLAFGESQKQAEAARKAIEENVKLEADRAYQQMDINQRVNLAMSGDKSAREKLIVDLAAANDEAQSLQAQSAQLIQARNDAQAEADKQLAIVFDDTKSLVESMAADDAWNAALVRIDAINKEMEGLSPTITAANDNLSRLQAATEKLGLTEEELTAVRLSETQGVDGTIAAITKLNEEQAKAQEFFTGIVDGIQEGLETAKDAIVKGAADIAADVAKKREEAEKSLIDINEKLIEVEQDRGKVLADRVIEAQRAREMGALETRLGAAQAYDAAVARNQKIKEITAQGHAADIQAQQKFMENQQKLLAGYIKAEQNATEDYSRERVRKLEDLYNTLNDLASKRDVAGFVNARRSGMQDIGRGDSDAGFAAQRRRADYEAQAAEQQAAFNKESAQREAQLQQRLEQERNAGNQVVKQADIVQKQIADLRARYAEQDLRARRAAEDATYQQTINILQKKRADELKITAGAAAGVIEIVSKIGQAANQVKGFLGGLSAKGAIPKFAEGTPFVNRTGLAVVHRGEAIIPASQNARLMQGGGLGGNQYTINLAVGEFATPSQIDAVETRIVRAITSFGANTNM
jgi:hypothetical protein